MTLTIKQKLILLILPALLCLLVFFTIDVVRLMDDKRKADHVALLLGVLGKGSELVHELQKERGLTAGYMGATDSATFSTKLQQQRKLADQMRSAYQEYLEENKGAISEPGLIAQLNDIDRKLSQLESNRSAVDQKSTSPSEAIGFYTSLNSKILAIASAIKDSAPNADISNAMFSYYSFLQGKERAGIERAVVNHGFSAGAFPPGKFETFIRLVAEQQVFFNLFGDFSTPENLSFFKQTLQGDAVNRVAQFRTYARAQDMQQSAPQWFDAATQRINLLKTIEDSLSEKMLVSAKAISSHSTKMLVLALIVGIVALTFSTVFSIMMIRGIQGQLKELVRVMDSAVSEHDLRQRVEVLSKDELGYLANGLNSMLDTLNGTVKKISYSCESLSEASNSTLSLVQGNMTNLERQNDDTLIVASSVEELTSTIQEVACNTTQASDAAQARVVLQNFEVDVLVVDVMMPGQTGLEFTKEFRKTEKTPIILLTALGETEDRITGLEAGADDYLPKPFEPRELVLRLNAILKRTAKKIDVRQRFRIGPWVFDAAENKLEGRDATIKLTAAETTLIEALGSSGGEVLSRDELARRCGVDAGERTIDVQVTRLRRKIEEDTKNPRYLQTVRGKGYLLRVEEL